MNVSTKIKVIFEYYLQIKFTVIQHGSIGQANSCGVLRLRKIKD